MTAIDIAEVNAYVTASLKTLGWWSEGIAEAMAAGGYKAIPWSPRDPVSTFINEKVREKYGDTDLKLQSSLFGQLHWGWEHLPPPEIPVAVAIFVESFHRGKYPTLDLTQKIQEAS